ncbi:uncharacterized protein LOC125944280 [Dermacentor silvarum]|uniref:uncharacterized protein LOC125944280 n=1 Tax=Dermacentor silvarum TaxID=543639 RepID=UPI0021010586|nr:uncharacterized protein LOC125944280 [Dermacentor silvarum]
MKGSVWQSSLCNAPNHHAAGRLISRQAPRLLRTKASALRPTTREDHLKDDWLRFGAVSGKRGNLSSCKRVKATKPPFRRRYVAFGDVVWETMMPFAPAKMCRRLSERTRPEATAFPREENSSRIVPKDALASRGLRTYLAPCRPIVKVDGPTQRAVVLLIVFGLSADRRELPSARRTCVMKCCVPGCPNRTENRRDGLSFHRFPRQRDLREEWALAVCRSPAWAPSHWSVVCSEHFSDGDFASGTKGHGHLMANAVPSLAGPTKMLAKDDATAMRQPSSAPASSAGISQHQDEPAGLSEVTIAMDISEGLSDVLAEGAAATASSSFADSDIADEPSEIQHVLISNTSNALNE